MLFVILGILIPFIGTCLGAMFVIFIKNEFNIKVEKALIGFAGGVMLAASIWSLIIPSLELANGTKLISCIPATLGFIVGIIFLMIIDKVTDKFENLNKKKNSMLVFAVTLHNIPEGMAVGVALAASMTIGGSITIAEALALAIGIAIQNIPEGAIISLALKTSDASYSKLKALWYGVFSGIVELLGAVVTLLLTNFIVPILPYLLSFAAGAMIYVTVNELIVESQSEKKTSYIGTIGITFGFLLMMILDVTLG